VGVVGVCVCVWVCVGWQRALGSVSSIVWYPSLVLSATPRDYVSYG